jgi:hypothetical protein
MSNLKSWKLAALSAALLIFLPVTINQSDFTAKQNEIEADAALTCDNIAVTGVTASGWSKNNFPGNTLDNNLNTRWSNSALGSWISYDIGVENVVCHLDIAWYKGNQRTYDFIISASSDGTTFTDIYTGNSVKSTALQRYDIPDTKARYLKIIVNGSSANSWAEITEVDIYGYAPDLTPPTIAITSPVNASSIHSGKIVIEGTTADNTGGSGVQLVEVRVANGTSMQATPIASNDWSFWTATVDIIAEGSHIIYAKATDGANNSNETSIAILVISDTGLPMVQISSPGNGSMINIIDGAPFSVSGNASDAESGINAVDIELDNSGIYYPTLPTSGGWSSWTGSLSIGTNGLHVITARATDNAGNVAYSSVPVNASITNTWLDKFGIKKIYPTIDAKEWYVAMEDPRSDPYFRNLQNLQLTLQPDGSWQVEASNGQVRMEAWSQENDKWLNVEITEYAKIVQTSNSLLQMYTRGGHHTSSDPCLGSAYKARLYGDGRAGWAKEVTHPAYSNTIGWMQATDQRLEDRWVGFKAVIYNIIGEDGRTYVRTESYIDDDVTDSNGNLVIRNNWQLASVVEDRGGWATTNADFTSTCSPMAVDNTGQYRQRDEILSLPGGTGTQNIGAWRSDGTIWDFKYLSVREIEPPQ